MWIISVFIKIKTGKKIFTTIYYRADGCDLTTAMQAG